MTFYIKYQKYRIYSVWSSYITKKYTNTPIHLLLRLYLSYLFKHVAGSVASPLHMLECYWSKVSSVVLNDDSTACVNSSSRVFNMRRQTAAVSTPSSGFIPPGCYHWHQTDQSEETGRERDTKLRVGEGGRDIGGNVLQVFVTKSKGVFYWWRPKPSVEKHRYCSFIKLS